VGHTFRKTVATWIDADPGTTPREVANQLGHKRAGMRKAATRPFI
jgi:integrase